MSTINVILKRNFYAGPPWGRFRSAGPRTSVALPAEAAKKLPKDAIVVDDPVEDVDNETLDTLAAHDLGQAAGDEMARLEAEAEETRLANAKRMQQRLEEEAADDDEDADDEDADDADEDEVEDDSDPLDGDGDDGSEDEG